MTLNDDDKVELLLDGNRGIYIPQHFCEDFNLDMYGLAPGDEDVAICKEGPDHEQYWDAWDSIQNKAKVTEDGHTWTLYQNGDLWLVRDDTSDEWFN